MSPHAKFCANICNNKQAMGDKLNSRWWPPQSQALWRCMKLRLTVLVHMAFHTLKVKNARFDPESRKESRQNHHQSPISFSLRGSLYVHQILAQFISK